MESINLDKNIRIYVFPADEGRTLGQTITVLFNKEKFMLIDTGYQKHMKEVLNVLDKENCEYAFCTHFHPDHTYGLYELNDDIKLIGSIDFLETLKIFNNENEKRQTPDIKVDGRLLFHYGEHELDISQNKGHSNCGTLTILNNKYLFVGDEIIFSNEGEPSLPYLATKNPGNHTKTLDNILDVLEGKTLIPAHGLPIYNFDEIKKDIDDRKIYLDYLIRKCTYEKFEKETGIKFINKQWHKNNI